MPHYEYECTQCGKRFEYWQKMSDAPKETCEECGGKLEKLLSAGSGLIFKGSGFYITDYKGGNAANSKSQTNDGANKSSGESAKSDSSGSSSSSPPKKEAK